MGQAAETQPISLSDLKRSSAEHRPKTHKCSELVCWKSKSVLSSLPACPTCLHCRGLRRLVGRAARGSWGQGALSHGPHGRRGRQSSWPVHSGRGGEPVCQKQGAIQTIFLRPLTRLIWMKLWSLRLQNLKHQILEHSYSPFCSCHYVDYCCDL